MENSKIYTIYDAEGKTIATVDFAQKPSYTMGRSENADIRFLANETVSDEHALLSLTEEGKLFLENLSQTNPIESREIEEQESFFLGTAEIYIKKTEKERATESEEREYLAFRFLLKLTDGPQRGAEKVLSSGSYILGQDLASCQIPLLGDSSVSATHLLLTLNEEGESFIEDLGSTNGTFLPGAERVEGKVTLPFGEEISIGSTRFLIIDQKAVVKTAPIPPPKKPEQIAKEEEDWRSVLVHRRHLLVATTAFCVLAVIVFSSLSIFHSETVVKTEKHPLHYLDSIFKKYPHVTHSYTEATGDLFLTGHVLTSVDMEELLFEIKALPFLEKPPQNFIVIDEKATESINGLLASQPMFQSVSIQSPEAGKFILQGYVKTLEEKSALSDFVLKNFDYHDFLVDEVAVQSSINTQIVNILSSHGLSYLKGQASDGTLILSGDIDKKDHHILEKAIKQIRHLRGMRTVQDLTNVITHTEGGGIVVQPNSVAASNLPKVEGLSYDGKEFTVQMEGRLLNKGSMIGNLIIEDISETHVLLKENNSGNKIKIPVIR